MVLLCTREEGELTTDNGRDSKRYNSYRAGVGVGIQQRKIVGMASKLGEEMKERFVDNIAGLSSAQVNLTVHVIRLTI